MFTSEDYDMLDDERATMMWERHCDGRMTEAEYEAALIEAGVEGVQDMDWNALFDAYDETFGVTEADV